MFIRAVMAVKAHLSLTDRWQGRMRSPAILQAGVLLSM
jgi:hypothetical protein